MRHPIVAIEVQGQNPRANEVIRANAAFYRDIAGKYDAYESCVSDPFLQQMLVADVARMRALLPSDRIRSIKCLDCGGGTGNVSIKLLQQGWDVTVVDVSREMLDILEARCRALGLSPKTHHGSLEDFFATDVEEYDVITFGSVLHHLHSYLGVLNEARKRLSRGGILYTNFDLVPPKHPRLARALDSVDTLLAKLLWDRGDVLPGIRRRGSKLFAKPSAPHDRIVASPGDLAEYHVPSGVEDQRIVRLLRDRGLEILEHSRFPVGRTRLVRAMNRPLCALQNFKVLARLSVERIGRAAVVRRDRPLSILSVHNYYQQRGGEDVVVESERELLAAFGHTVTSYSRRSREIEGYGPGQRASLLLRTVWAWDSHEEIKRLLEDSGPQVAHFHNTLPLISPAAYYACRDAGVPVVQTLHNYRLFCPAATFYRRGRVCEECVQHSLWRSVRYGCYRDSRSTTATLSLMLATHRLRETWDRKVDLYVALTNFARKKFIDAGLDEDKVVVKPNFVHPDPGCVDADGEYAVYVGRLCQEKGLKTLLEAWRRLPAGVPLRIVGEGPLRQELEREAEARGLDDVQFLGWQPRENVLGIIQRARFLLFTSEWYETFGRTAIEAFACGVPVVASRLGAMEEIVEDQRSGLHFTPGDSRDLADKVHFAWSHPKRIRDMGQEARREFEAKYTRERNYQRLLEIYERAIAG